MAGSLSALGIGSNAGLNADTIDGLKNADKSIMVDPIDKKIEANKTKKSDLSTLITYLAGTKSQASSLSDDTSYLKRTTSVTGSAITATADTAVSIQDIDVGVTQLAKQSTFESSSFSSLDSLVFASSNATDRTFSFYVGDTEKTVNLGQSSVTYADLIEAINDQVGSSVTASTLKVGDNEYKMILKADTTGSANQISFGKTALANARESVGSVDLSGLTYPYTTGAGESLSLNGATIIGSNGSFASSADLITEINTNLTTAGLDSSFEASLDSNNKLVIKSLDGSAFSLSESGGGTISSDLGLGSMELYADSGFTIADSQLKINGIDIVSGADTSFSTMSDLVDLINSKTSNSSSSSSDGTGVFASLDSSGNLELKDVNGGAITLSGTEWSKLGFSTTTQAAESDGGVSGSTEDVSASILSTVGFSSLQNAQDSKFTFNGVEVTRSSNSVNDLIVGLSLELETTGDSTIRIKRDTSSITDYVSEFISAYNLVLNKWSDLTDYNEETGVAGSLQGISEVTRVKSNLNRLILDYDGTRDIKSLSEIGLELTESGLLTFDSTKLDQKLSEDADAVEKLFKGYTSTIGGGKSLEIDGVFAKLNKELEKIIGDNGSLSLYDTNLQTENDNLATEREKAVERIDARYSIMATQFAAYDSLISQMNNGFSALQMQIDAMVSSK